MHWFIIVCLVIISGITLDYGTLGIAYDIGTICQGANSTSVTADGGMSLSIVYLTAAHELGHLLNMHHDYHCMVKY